MYLLFSDCERPYQDSLLYINLLGNDKFFYDTIDHEDNANDGGDDCMIESRNIANA